MGWAGFAAVFAAFFLTHSVPLRPAVKARLVAVTGARAFGMAYSLLSLGMLALLIHAAGEAPHVLLWGQWPWQVHVVQAGMLAVCLLLAFSVARPNPFSFGGARNERFDPARPGVVRVLRHPVLVALGLWAGLHLLPNGDLAHVVLFGVLGAFALAGMRLVDRRKKRLLGDAAWQRLNREVRAGPLIPVPVSWAAVAGRAAIGLSAYGVLVALHPVVIGVPVM